MNLSLPFLGRRCSVCGKRPVLTGHLTRCHVCGAEVCSSCWRSGSLLNVIVDGCPHRQVLPGQQPDMFP